MEFAGKVAVVTGGASGIGRGIAEEFIARGAVVVIADIEQAALESTAEEIGATGIRCDVSDYASVEALARSVVAQFHKVDILVNNAGVGSLAPLSKMTIDDWNWMLGVNLWGTIHGVQAFLPYLAANPDGAHVAATTSIGGFTTMPMLVPYSVSKYAVVALMEGLRMECEKDGLNIGVTLLAPGPIRSNIHNSMRNRPEASSNSGFFDVDLDQLDAFEGGVPWKEPIFAGKVLADAIATNRLYVTTHPDSAQEIYARMHRVEETLKQPI